MSCHTCAIKATQAAKTAGIYQLNNRFIYHSAFNQVAEPASAPNATDVLQNAPLHELGEALVNLYIKDPRIAAALVRASEQESKIVSESALETEARRKRQTQRWLKLKREARAVFYIGETASRITTFEEFMGVVFEGKQPRRKKPVSTTALVSATLGAATMFLFRGCWVAVEELIDMYCYRFHESRRQKLLAQLRSEAGSGEETGESSSSGFLSTLDE